MSANRTGLSSPSDEVVPLPQALRSLSELQEDIDDVGFKLDQRLREAMEPLGFGFDPKKWRRTVKKVFSALNDNYRYEVRADILRSARKIRQQKGVVRLLERMVEARRAALRIDDLLNELKELRKTNSDILAYPDSLYLEQHVTRFEQALELVKYGTNEATGLLNEARLYITFLGRPVSNVREDLQYLHVSVPQCFNADAAKPALMLLVALHEERLEMSAQTASIATSAYHAICSHSVAVPRSAFRDDLARLQDIQKRLKAQEIAQPTFLADFEKYSNLAASTPKMFASVAISSTLLLARLRRGDEEYKAIVDKMNQVYEPLEAAVSEVIKFLRNKFATAQQSA